MPMGYVCWLLFAVLPCTAHAQYELIGRLQLGAERTSANAGYSLAGAITPVVPGPAMAGGGYDLAGVFSPGVASSVGDFDPQPEPPGLPSEAVVWLADGDALDSVGRIQGTLTGNAAFGPGRRGQAFLFPGGDRDVQGRITFTGSTGNFGTADFTISLFVHLPLLRSTTAPRHQHLLGKRVGCNHHSFWNIGFGASGIPFFEYDENSAGKNYGSASGTSSMRDGEWHHLAVVRQGNRIQLFQDGRLASTKETEGTVPFSNTASLWLGAGPCTDGGARGLNVWPFGGSVDDLRFFDSALAPIQVAALAGLDWSPTVTRQPVGRSYHGPASEHRLSVTADSLGDDSGSHRYQWFRNGEPIRGATTSNLVIHPVNGFTAGTYSVRVSNRYGSATSTAATVLVRSDNPLAPAPDHWWTAEGHAEDRVGTAHGSLVGNLTFGPGVDGQAFLFPGGDADVSGSVQLPASTGNFATSDFTVEYWLRTTNRILSEVVSKRHGCGHGNWWETFMSADGRPFAQVDEDNTGRNYVGVAPPAGTGFADGQWHHVAFVRERAALRLYLDGRRVDERFSDGTVPLDNDAPLRFGVGACTDGGRRGFNVWPFAGALDEIKFFHLALTDRQIAAAAERRVVPAVLGRTARSRALVDADGGTSRFRWVLEPDAGRPFTAEDVGEVALERSVDLRLWKVVPGAVRLVDGSVEVIDPELFRKRESFYRLAFRDPSTPTRPNGGMVDAEIVPADVIATARAHISAFLGPLNRRTNEEADWIDVVVDTQVRPVYDPSYRDATEPAFYEVPVLDGASSKERGYILVSATEGTPVVVEFATEGPTKTAWATRALAGVVPDRFVRFGPGFLAMEDDSGRLLGSLGTWPSLPAGTAPTETREYRGDYDSESETGVSIPGIHFERLVSPDYAALKRAFADNPTRTALRTLRARGRDSRREALGDSRRLLSLEVGATAEVQVSRPYAAVRVDSDDDEGLPAVEELVSVAATLSRNGGFRVTGLREGSDLVRARTLDGQVETYVVVVGRRAAALAAFLPECYEIDTAQWVAGTGWHGDQRQYHQPESDLWCPVVGCGPVALAMLFGWWDVHGVPSAFYHLDSGFGEPTHFRFRLTGLQSGNAAKTMTAGQFMQPPGFPHEFYVLSPEERVVHDLHRLAHTFCVDGQGATTPDQMVSAAVEYIDRVSRNLHPPQDEFGERFLSAKLSHSYTDGYWLGMTDWKGGGVKVANGIKAGRPGVVGLGDTLFDLHYALAYAYKRIDTYHLCSGDRKRVGRTRWFKCNMGWGAEKAPEWHDAESVWFGLTADLTQVKVP